MSAGNYRQADTVALPRLEYASSVWDPHTDCLKTSLEAVQRRAARFVRADYSRYSSVAAMLNKLKWEPLEYAVEEVVSRSTRLLMDSWLSRPMNLNTRSARLEYVLTQLATSQSYTQIPTPYATVSSIAPSEIGTTYQTKSSNPLQ